MPSAACQLKTIEYDEQYQRMDEWMVGRRDVALDGNRSGRRRPAGGRDPQAVQEIIQSRGCEVNLYQMRLR